MKDALTFMKVARGMRIISHLGGGGGEGGGAQQGECGISESCRLCPIICSAQCLAPQ